MKYLVVALVALTVVALSGCQEATPATTVPQHTHDPPIITASRDEFRQFWNEYLPFLRGSELRVTLMASNRAGTNAIPDWYTATINPSRFRIGFNAANGWLQSIASYSIPVDVDYTQYVNTSTVYLRATNGIMRTLPFSIDVQGFGAGFQLEHNYFLQGTNVVFTITTTGFVER